MPRLSEILDTNNLKVMLDKGYISQQTHPTLPLTILNYTHKAQFDNVWNNETIWCRGLIYEYESPRNLVVALPFPKFFNINDASHPETKYETIKEFENQNNVSGVLTEKLDGSLGILWQFKGNYGVATRGSFTSDQAKWATEWLNDHRQHTPVSWNQYYTPLCEIIYPKNRIVVEYPFKGLIIIGMMNHVYKIETSYKVTKTWARSHSLLCVKKVNKSLNDVLNEDSNYGEGYVYTLNLIAPIKTVKVKIKFPTYCKLHKVITGWSPKDVWEILKEKSDYNKLFEDSNIPEHFKTWFTKWKTLLSTEYKAIETEARERFASLDCSRSRKLIANDILKTDWRDKRIIPVLFKMLDNKPFDDVIWKQIKPKGNDKIVSEDAA